MTHRPRPVPAPTSFPRHGPARRLILALGLALLSTGPLVAQAGAGLCQQMLAESGEGTRGSTALQGQAGIGWNFGPETSFDELGGGPLSQFSLYLDRLYATDRCDEEGGIEVGLIPHGIRASVALSNAFWSDYTGASLAVAYLHTGSALKWWLGPQLSGQGVDTDNVGLGLGATAGVGLYNWLAATAAPTWLVRGRGVYGDGFLFTVQVSISRKFREEHF